MTTGKAGGRPRDTRTAILAAFRDLVLARRYSDIRVADIVRRADAGRSTFYEHFRGKDDVLRHSLAAVLTPLAEAVRGYELFGTRQATKVVLKP